MKTPISTAPHPISTTSAISFMMAIVFGFLALFFITCRIGNSKTSPAPQGAVQTATLLIDNGSPAAVSVPVYLVELDGQKYYATESSSRFFSLAPVIKQP